MREDSQVGQRPKQTGYVKIPPRSFHIPRLVTVKFFGDVGFPGPHRGKGGKFLLLPPDCTSSIRFFMIVIDWLIHQITRLSPWNPY
jgi:hypothetical protein